ncbi:MAG: hypothetical protein M1281_13380 [Chloroflexi bacterium]|nr:hypothetical protein [Chloroflexota bacterium]
MRINLLVQSIFWLLLRLYPVRFQAEFGDEMQEVLALTLENSRSQGRANFIGSIWREFANLPASIVKVHWRNFQAWEENMSLDFKANSQLSKIEFSPADKSIEGRLISTLLAVLPFIPFSIAIVTYRHLRLDYSVTAWIQWGALAMLFLGILAGWLNDFPHWSYPYTGIFFGIALIFALGSDRDMTFLENLYIKLVILGPIVLIFALIWWLLRRSHPLRRLFQNARADWTLIPFCIYSFLTLVISIVFTNIRSVYGAPFLAAATLVEIAGVIGYMLLARPAWRISALALAMTLVWAISTLGSATFWHNRPFWIGSGTGNGYQIAAQYAGYWAVMLLVMLLPFAAVWLWRAMKKP